MPDIEVRVTGQEAVEAALRRLLVALGPGSVGIFQAVGEAIREGVDTEFATSGGGEWADLSERTKAERAKIGQVPPYRPLIRHGLLRGSMVVRPNPRGVAVGTNRSYAPIHQFGGRSESGAMVPARPYLVLRPATGREVEATVVEALDAAVDGRPARGR